MRVRKSEPAHNIRLLNSRRKNSDLLQPLRRSLFVFFRFGPAYAVWDGRQLRKRSMRLGLVPIGNAVIIIAAFEGRIAPAVFD